MRIKSTLTALAAGIGLMAVAGTTSAINLGEVWVGDQAEGEILIYKQSKLNRRGSAGAPSTVHAHDSKADARLHLIGFNNRPGLSSKSRAVVAYLNGDIQMYATNAGTGSPTLLQTTDITTTSNSLHMCGSNPKNTGMACSSIGGKEIILLDADDSTNTYASTINSYKLATMGISGAAPLGTAATFANISGGAPICNNYDTSGNYLYVTVNTGGLFIMDVSDPANATVINAYDSSVIPATGCGLVNAPNGKSMYTNSGSNNDADDERAFNWKFRDIGTSNMPTVIDIPEDDHGDVHGAQFAGPGVYLWELMRLDNVIHVINSHTNAIVNTFSVATRKLGNPAGDVLDRSAFGGYMYASLRGFAPITAIVAFDSLDRDPGVMTIKSRWFGYTGKVRKVTSIRSQHGNTTFACPSDFDGHPPHDSGCVSTDPDAVEVDAADPHGLKSLQYLTGF